MKKLLLTGIAVLFLATGTASAGNYRPGYPSTAWVKECLTPEQIKGDNIHTCRAYIHGLINALAIWQVLSTETAQVCMSGSADFGKMREQILPQVRKEARDNISASQLLFYVLAEQFPCNKQTHKERAS